MKYARYSRCFDNTDRILDVMTIGHPPLNALFTSTRSDNCLCVRLNSSLVSARHPSLDTPHSFRANFFLCLPTAMPHRLNIFTYFCRCGISLVFFAIRISCYFDMTPILTCHKLLYIYLNDPDHFNSTPCLFLSFLFLPYLYFCHWLRFISPFVV